MNEIIGEDRYTLTIEYNEYTLIVEASANDQLWYKEILLMINNIKPANMIFINKPVIYGAVLVAESVGATKRIYNYRASTTAHASSTMPLITRIPIGTVKDEKTMSVQLALLNYLASETADKVGKVTINDVYDITIFTFKDNNANEAIIEYIVPWDYEEEITKVQLKATDNSILTDITFNIGIKKGADDMVLKHKIPIREGV